LIEAEQAHWRVARENSPSSTFLNLPKFHLVFLKGFIKQEIGQAFSSWPTPPVHFRKLLLPKEAKRDALRE